VRIQHKILVRNSDGKQPVGRHSADGTIILKCILDKKCGQVWTRFI